MDIHRCRFFPYPTSSINALAFSHNLTPKQRSPSSLRLALGRGNGDIEIWNPNQGLWSQEAIFHGGKNRSVEGLVWTQDLEEEITDQNEESSSKLRLFSIGYSNAITEWNLSTGLPLRHSSGDHAAVWSLAAQPRWRKEDGIKTKADQLLALGCADGSIVLQSTADGELTYVRALRRPSNLKARVLSLTFCGRKTIAAGYSDGVIVVFDVGGKIKSTMHLGSGPTRAATYVWAVRDLGAKCLVSGDSTGELKFWDLRTYTITQRLSCHDSDILTVATNAGGTRIFAGAIDGKVFTVHKDKILQRWKIAQHQRKHTDQIKSIAALDSADLSVVVSGGMDSSPIVIPLSNFGKENIRVLPALPQTVSLLSAPANQLLVSWWDREVALCVMNDEMLQRVSMQSAEENDTGLDSLQRILLQGEENISAVSVASSGQLIAIGTNSSCRIFALSTHKRVSFFRRIRQIQTENCKNQSARLLQFSPDGKWLLCVSLENRILLYRVQADASTKAGWLIMDDPIELQKPKPVALPELTALESYPQTISKVAWSEDSSILACAHISGSINIWTRAESKNQPNGLMNGHKKQTQSDESDSSDSEGSTTESGSIDGMSWKLLKDSIPRMPSSPLILSFRPNTKDQLLILTSQHDLFEFHALTGKLTAWSKRNPPSHLPVKFSQILDRTMGCVWDVHDQKQRVWLYGSAFVFMLDLSKELDARNAGRLNLKRKRSENEVRRRTNGAGNVAEFPMDFGMDEEDGDISGRTTGNDDDDVDDSEGDETDPSRKGQSGDGFWCTHKYRSILGLVQLNRVTEGDLEVALVERHLFE